MRNAIKKILIINTFGIGDVLFTTPLIANLKAYDPGFSIGYLCNRRTLEILESNSKIDRTFVYERDEFEDVRRQSRTAYDWKLSGFLADIKKENYDLVFDLSLSGMMGFLTWRIGIKRRVGFDYKRRGFFLTQRIPLNGYSAKHVIEHYLELLEPLGIPIQTRQMELTIPKADVDWADHFLWSQGLGTGPNPVLGLVPGGGASWGKEAFYKRWSAEKYAKLADNLIEKLSTNIILMGDQNEVKLCGEVASRMSHRPVIVCGKTTLGQFAALAQKCSIMIVNDGGPLHLAVASGVRTASIFGPVDESVYGPYPKGNHIVIGKHLACRPCYRRFRKAACDHMSCLNQLTVEEVLQALDKGGVKGLSVCKDRNKILLEESI